MSSPTPANEILPDPRADAALGHCAWFVWDLRRSGLVERDRADNVLNHYLQTNPDAEPPELANFLVRENILTNLQAERLLQGKTDGFVLGPYTLTDVLGAGSMGTVYKARSKADNKLYALKVLPRRSLWNVRLARRWVKSFAQVRHPSVVAFVDVGTSGGLHYLAWPFVEGRALDRAVAAKGKLLPGQASLISLQTAEALYMCHQLGLYHGLLKPSNLLIDHDGRLRLLDCGIGCLLGHSPDESMVDTMSTANAIVAGLDCASPERIADPKAVTPLGDQYSLGCVLYFLLTGGFPFPGKAAVEKMVGHQLKQATPVRQLEPNVPEGLAAIVARLMQKDPAARYPSCLELVEELRPFAEIPKRQVSRPVPNLKAPAARSAPAAPSALPPIRPPVAAIPVSAADAETEIETPSDSEPEAEQAPVAAAVAAPAPAPRPVPTAAPRRVTRQSAKPPVPLFVRIALFLLLIAGAGFLQFGADPSWFEFAGDKARLVSKGIASAFVTGAVLVLMLPRRRNSG
jgi:serine/threonine-protein kinase